MKIILGKTAGFCHGVKRAVENAEIELENTNKLVYCLGEIVHNKQVIENLEKKGLITIDNIEEAKGKTIVRAHGVEKEVYKKAKDKNIDLVDLTCPKVLKIHEIAENYAKKGWYIFLIGKKEHPEIIGTSSFCGNNYYVISKIEDLPKAIDVFNKTKIKKLAVISQTTYSLYGFDIIVEKLKKSIDNNVEIQVKKTICMATELRQKETEELSKNVECMVIIGGKNSSNTNKLYEIALKNCNNVFFVQNKNDICLNKIKKFQTIGIMAGASTPKSSIDEVMEMIKGAELIEA